MQNGSVSDTVILEGYVLDILFYSTDGSMWQNPLEFLTPSAICQWNNGSIVSAYGVNCDADETVQQVSVEPYRPRWFSFPISKSCRCKSTPCKVLFLPSWDDWQRCRYFLLVRFVTWYFAYRVRQLGRSWKTISLGKLIRHRDHSNGVGRLTNLQIFTVSWNSMSGSLPTELGRMTSLIFMFANFNISQVPFLRS